MATRNSAKMSAEIKSYLDDAIKKLVRKSNIDSMKNFIEEQRLDIDKRYCLKNINIRRETKC